jgi:hypothetical protein
MALFQGVASCWILTSVFKSTFSLLQIRETDVFLERMLQESLLW